MDDLRDNFILEQYKRIINRIESNEKIYYQMLVLYITVFGVVLGFSEKIFQPELFVPFILLSFLLIVTLICNGHTKDQRFETAYLIEIFEKRWRDISFSYYMHNFKSNQKEKSRFIKYIIHPIFILYVLTLVTSFYFLRDIIKNIFDCYKNNIYYIAYLIIVLILAIGVLLVYHKMQKGDLKKSIKEIKEYENTDNNNHNK